MDAYKGPRWHEDGYVIDAIPLETEGLLAVGLADGRLIFRLLDKPEMPLSDALPVHEHGLVAMTVGFDKASILSIGEDGTLRKTTRDGEIKTLFQRAGARFEHMALHDSGLVAISYKKTVLLIQAEGTLKAEWADHPSTVQGLCFDPKGKRLIAAHYGGISSWWVNGEAGQKPDRKNWKGSHLAVAFSPNGKYILTAMQENTLHGWRLPDFSDFQMSGYAQKPKSFAWDSSGRWLATSGAPGITCWDCGGKGPMGKPPMVLAEQSPDVTIRIAPHPVLPLVAGVTLSGQAFLARLEDERIVWLHTAAMDGTAEEFTCLRWSETGQTLTGGTESGAVYSWTFAE